MAAEKVKAIDWREDALHLLDQRVLPFQEIWLTYTSAAGVAEAIRSMVVRGAPAIGISAAYGVVLGARARIAAGGDWVAALEEDFQVLAGSRPTAVNLFWALNRMRDRLQRIKHSDDALQALEAEAVAIHLSDREANLTMAQLGADLIRKHHMIADAAIMGDMNANHKQAIITDPRLHPPACGARIYGYVLPNRTIRAHDDG